MAPSSTPEPFSLIRHAWLPVRRADGSREVIRPAEITSGLNNNPVVAFDWSRADFDAASREFLIGLLATACPVRAGGDEWREWFDKPPEPSVLDAAFAPLEHAFSPDGAGPRFMQDLSELDGDAVPASQLLIEAPGANALKKNLDHFVRRGRVEVLSRAAAAMALFTLQTYAPAGGAGHRTSLRGGGPLTTLVIPGEDPKHPIPALWRLLWLNCVAPDFDPDADEDDPAPLERILPWLVPTRVSDKKVVTTPEDTHFLQAYWGMPRRIRLVFEPNPDAAPCDLTGTVDSVIVRGWRTRPYGANYAAFRHPLSPHYRQKDTDPEWLPVHGQPGRVGYRHWIGFIETGQDRATRRIADSVHLARRRIASYAALRRGARFLAAGYDMDNMKARGFAESEMPLHLVPEEIALSFNTVIRNMVLAARDAQGILTGQIRAARGRDLSFDRGVLASARDRFWDGTEAPFHRLADDLAVRLDLNRDGQAGVMHEFRMEWKKELAWRVRRLFDDAVPAAGLEALRLSEMRNIVEARRWLCLALEGYGKRGAGFYTSLGLEPPKAGRAARSSREVPVS